jgi:hypothetical protein
MVYAVTGGQIVHESKDNLIGLINPGGVDKVRIRPFKYPAYALGYGGLFGFHFIPGPLRDFLPGQLTAPGKPTVTTNPNGTGPGYADYFVNVTVRDTGLRTGPNHRGFPGRHKRIIGRSVNRKHGPLTNFKEDVLVLIELDGITKTLREIVLLQPRMSTTHLPNIAGIAPHFPNKTRTTAVGGRPYAAFDISTLLFDYVLGLHKEGPVVNLETVTDILTGSRRNHVDFPDEQVPVYENTGAQYQEYVPLHPRTGNGPHFVRLPPVIDRMPSLDRLNTNRCVEHIVIGIENHTDSVTLGLTTELHPDYCAYTHLFCLLRLLGLRPPVARKGIFINSLQVKERVCNVIGKDAISKSSLEILRVVDQVIDVFVSRFLLYIEELRYLVNGSYRISIALVFTEMTVSIKESHNEELVPGETRLVYHPIINRNLIPVTYHDIPPNST